MPESPQTADHCCQVQKNSEESSLPATSIIASEHQLNSHFFFSGALATSPPLALNALQTRRCCVSVC